MKKFYIIGIIIVIAIIAVIVIRVGVSSNKNKDNNNNTNNKTKTYTTSKGNETNKTAANNTAENKEEEKVYLTGKHNVEINVKDYGKISVELDADIAPITVTNFIKLTKEGFYDGLTFHRIINGFMIQGGAPLGNGTGGSSENIKGEFAKNGVKNPLLHTRGVISMARSGKMDSASSQFFIVQQDSPHLDGAYAAFGHVTSGIEIVDKICEVTPVEDSNGTVLKANQPVINSIKVID